MVWMELVVILNWGLRQIVRVGEGGGHVELEVVVVLDLRGGDADENQSVLPTHILRRQGGWGGKGGGCRRKQQAPEGQFKAEKRAESERREGSGARVKGGKARGRKGEWIS